MPPRRGCGARIAPLAPDRLIGAQLRRADQLAIDKRPVDKVAFAEAIFGVTDKDVVRHTAAEAQVSALRAEAKQMFAKCFHVGRPQTPDFNTG